MAVIKSGPLDSIVFVRATRENVGSAQTDANAVVVPTQWGSGGTADSLAVGSAALGIQQVGDATAFELSDETLGMAAGYDKNCLQRHQLNITLYQPNAWLLLNDAQVGNQPLVVQARWSDGSVSTWNKVRITASPILNPIPNLAEAYYNDSATADIADLPSTSGWTSLGTVLVDGGATVTPATITDGEGKNLYASNALEHIVEVDFAHWGSDADAVLDDGVPHSIGFKLPDGNFFTYSNVYVEVRRNNVVGLEAVRTTRLRVAKGAGNFVDILTLPNQGALAGDPGLGTHTGGTIPDIPDCVFGINVVGIASGLDESDFYIES